MTSQEVSKLVAILFASFPSQSSKLSAEQAEATIAIYTRMLADLDYATASSAVERLLGTAKFIPTIAEIREACLAITDGPQRPGGDAWGDVLAAVSRYGIYRTPSFDDPVVAHCVKQLGWTEICNSTNQPADRARFIELYDRLKSHERVEKLTGHLPAQTRLRELREQATAFEAPDAGKLAQFVGNSLARRGEPS